MATPNPVRLTSMGDINKGLLTRLELARGLVNAGKGAPELARAHPSDAEHYSGSFRAYRHLGKVAARTADPAYVEYVINSTQEGVLGIAARRLWLPGSNVTPGAEVSYWLGNVSKERATKIGKHVLYTLAEEVERKHLANCVWSMTFPDDEVKAEALWGVGFTRFFDPTEFVSDDGISEARQLWTLPINQTYGPRELLDPHK